MVASRSYGPRVWRQGGVHTYGHPLPAGRPKRDPGGLFARALPRFEASKALCATITLIRRRTGQRPVLGIGVVKTQLTSRSLTSLRMCRCARVSCQLRLWVAKKYIVVLGSTIQGSDPDMNKTAPVSVRLDADLNERMTAVARALDRPKSWVIEQAVQDFVAMQEWQLAAIDEGLRAADAGRVVAHEDVVAWVQSWGRSDELPMPKCE